MAKIKWEVYGESAYVYKVVANTRAMAVAIAQSEWLKDTGWENELVGTVCEDGSIFTRSSIPEFTAIKHGPT